MSGGAKALSGDRQLRLTACHLSSFSFTKQWPPAHSPSPHTPSHSPASPPSPILYILNTSEVSHALRYKARRKSQWVIHWLRQMWSYSHSPLLKTHTRTVARTQKEIHVPNDKSVHTDKVISGLGLHSPGGLRSCHTHTNTHQKRQNKSS